jgi:hypothetical protein
MRGGAQSQLMLGADARLWVVKFQNNPQHIRVLANELIATRLAEALGLSVPASDVIEVTDWLATHTPDLFVDFGRGRRERCASGLHFGSAFVGGLMPGQVVDFLPEPQLDDVRNHAEFAGMLALDKWTGNCNGRQAVFERKQRERRYRAIFIDQGFCFAPARRLPAFERLRPHPRVGVVRTLAQPSRNRQPQPALGDRRGRPAGMVRRRPRHHRAVDGATARPPFEGTGPHHRLQELDPRPVPKLELQPRARPIRHVAPEGLDTDGTHRTDGGLRSFLFRRVPVPPIDQLASVSCSLF